MFGDRREGAKKMAEQREQAQRDRVAMEKRARSIAMVDKVDFAVALRTQQRAMEEYAAQQRRTEYEKRMAEAIALGVPMYDAGYPPGTGRNDDQAWLVYANGTLRPSSMDWTASTLVASAWYTGESGNLDVPPDDSVRDDFNI